VSAPVEFICGGSGITPEGREELDRLREHMTAHRGKSISDCRFCAEREAKRDTPTDPTP
jgi:hypothetical protein